MVRDEGGSDELQRILESPRGHLIHIATDTLGAIKIGLKIDRSEIPADVYAVMMCLERESNKWQSEKMNSSK